MSTQAVLFEQALSIAVERVKAAGRIATEITLVRDLRGRIRLLLPGSETDYEEEQRKVLGRLRVELSRSLGNYGFPAEGMTLFIGDLSLDIAEDVSFDRLPIAEEGEVRVFLLDRQITGQDWLREPFKRDTSNPRATFFGIKGGVGRSTALIIWAWRLAKQGKKVLIFDLDLESPGVSSTLLPEDASPDFGIVDWFVEDGVGQPEVVEREMVARSPLAGGLPGEIGIVPAFGSKTTDYLPELARCYGDAPGKGPSSWSARLDRMVTTVEKSETLDIVIFDSRAGIHDIAAAAVTRMGAQSFLFAVDSHQTWNAYTFLFRNWKQYPALVSVRAQLQIVASMIPETGREEYLRQFREHSWDVFREHLYDEAEPHDPDAFSFDLNEEGAPHNPLPLFWHRALQEFGPVRSKTGLDEKTAEEALGDFMDQAERLVFDVREAT